MYKKIIIFFIFNITTLLFASPFESIIGKLGFIQKNEEIELANFGINYSDPDQSDKNIIYGEFFKIITTYKNNNFLAIATYPIRINLIGTPEKNGTDSEILFNLLTPISLTIDLIDDDQTITSSIAQYISLPINLLNSEIRLYPFNIDNLYFMFGNNGNIYFNDKKIIFRDTIHFGLTIQKGFGLEIILEQNIIDRSEPFLIKFGIILDSKFTDYLGSV